MTKMSTPENGVEIEEASLDDCLRLFGLRNDSFVIANSKSGLAVDWIGHSAWFTAALAQPDRHWIAFVREAGTDIGVVRFERSSKSAAAISVYLLAHATGRGLGPKVIRQACKDIAALWGLSRIDAEIVPRNRPSLSAFEKAGFVPAALENGVERLQLVIRPAPPQLRDRQ